MTFHSTVLCNQLGHFTLRRGLHSIQHFKRALWRWSKKQFPFDYISTGKYSFGRLNAFELQACHHPTSPRTAMLSIYLAFIFEVMNEYEMLTGVNMLKTAMTSVKHQNRSKCFPVGIFHKTALGHRCISSELIKLNFSRVTAILFWICQAFWWLFWPLWEAPRRCWIFQNAT